MITVLLLLAICAGMVQYAREGYRLKKGPGFQVQLTRRARRK